MVRFISRSYISKNSKLSYAVIKNLRRRIKNSAASAASDDLADVIETTTSLPTKVANDGCQVLNSSNSNISAADANTPLSFGNTVYSAGATDDDFGFLLHDSSSPRTPYSSTGMESLTEGNASTGRFSSEHHHAALAPSSTMRTQHYSNATTSSTDDHVLDGMDYDSLALDSFPQMELGVTNSFVGDGWMPSTIEGLDADTSSTSYSVHALGEARRVSLFLEDMQPETANRVTTMLLNGNVDLKMKMTIR